MQKRWSRLDQRVFGIGGPAVLRSADLVSLIDEVIEYRIWLFWMRQYKA